MTSEVARITSTACAAILASALAGCGPSDQRASSPEPGKGTEPPAWPHPLPGPSASATHEVPLITTVDDGVADVQVVPIVFEGEDAWLALDTGSPLTFLFSDPAGPEYVDEAGTIQIGT